VGNLREMGNSLRANAERLLGDVQRIHSQLTAQITRAERATGIASGTPGRRARGSAPDLPSNVGRTSPAADDGLDVPEFIPPG
jgi:hypothetical protein